jgi:molecular chaperone DnaK
VITVPAYFNHPPRDATKRAGQRAGLEVIKIINEPTAAAIAYGLTEESQPRTILVYDLGGGTFDVTLMKITANGIDVLATGGDHRLGGKNWDEAIAMYLSSKFEEEHGMEVIEDLSYYDDLLSKSEAAKMQLSSRDKVNVSLTYKGKRGNYELTLETFNNITFDLLSRTEAYVNHVLAEQKFSWADIDGILLVGGSTRMRMVPELVRTMSGKEPLRGIYVDDAVAQGAAIQAEILRAGSDTILPALGGKAIADVTAHSLGMVAINNDRSGFMNRILITHNSKIPAQATKPFKVNRRDCPNNETDIYVLQGESQRPLDCQILGRYIVSGIDLSRGDAVIDVTYSYDVDGIVHVSAVQQEVNRQLPIRVEPVPDDMSWLDRSPDELKKVPTQVSIALVVDLSYSMMEAMETVRLAIQEMIANFGTAPIKMGLIGFHDDVKTLIDLADPKKVANNTSILEVGGTTSANPLPQAYELLRDQPGKRIIIVLTDGRWFYPEPAIESAQKCIAENIEIIAIGFADADENFLRKISSADENALYTSLDNLADSFVNIAQVISESSLSAM